MKPDDEAAVDTGSPDESRPADDPRRPYTPPLLEPLGDLRDLTFGPSPGSGDSVSPGERKVLGT
jgi:hypothetical protein